MPQSVDVRTLMLRRASARDAEGLATLSFRSKAHWGYDAEFMERVRPVLSPPVDYLENSPVYLLEVYSGDPIAFYGFKDVDGETYLHDFFVAPEWIGQGIGATLWLHALATARQERYSSFLIESDPYAQGFYEHMGAELIGQIPAAPTGRLLPLLRYTLTR